MNNQMLKIWQEKNFVIVDTETTGLKSPCQIIDFAMIDAEGNVLFDQLLKPTVPISEFITGLTGITNEMVADASNWRDSKSLFLEAMHGKTVITYNAKFDRHMMHCSDEMWHIADTDYHDGIQWACAMEAYAPLHGDWNEYYQSFRWCSLTTAIQEQGLRLLDARRASADALMTLDLLNHCCFNGDEYLSRSV